MAAGEVIAFAGMVAAAGGGIFLGYQCGTDAARREHDDLVRRLHADELTLLPNRRALYAEMDRRAAAGEGYALAMLDLDRFKAINDALGHAAGDWVLFQVAARLREVASETGWFAARLHGDEFAVVLPAMSADQAAMAAWAIHERTGEPLPVQGHLLFPWATVGVAIADAAEAPNDVRRRADLTMYRAKRTESGIAVFDPALDAVPPLAEERPRVRLRDVATLDPELGVAAA